MPEEGEEDAALSVVALSLAVDIYWHMTKEHLAKQLSTWQLLAVVALPVANKLDGEGRQYVSGNQQEEEDRRESSAVTLVTFKHTQLTLCLGWKTWRVETLTVQLELNNDFF